MREGLAQSLNGSVPKRYDDEEECWNPQSHWTPESRSSRFPWCGPNNTEPSYAIGARTKNRRHPCSRRQNPPEEGTIS